MSEIDLDEIDRRVLLNNRLPQLIEAAATVANTIHAGAGELIKGTLMEYELRRALGLKPGELVNISRRL